MKQIYEKRIVFFALLMISFTSFAFLKPENESLTTYYAGTGLGGINGQFQTTSLTQVNPSFSFFSNQSISLKTSDTDLLGSFFMGKLFAFHGFFLGPEIYANVGSPDSSWTESANLLFPDESLVTNTKSQLNTIDLGIDGRFGKLINRSSLFYVRMGASFNKLTNTITTVNSRSSVPLSVTANNSSHHNLIGFRVGAGFEQAITSLFSIRGDYIFTYYPSVSQSFTSVNDSSSVVQLGPVTNSTSTQVGMQAFLISLLYHWDSYHEK